MASRRPRRSLRLVRSRSGGYSTAVRCGVSCKPPTPSLINSTVRLANKLQILALLRPSALREIEAEVDRRLQALDVTRDPE